MLTHSIIKNSQVTEAKAQMKNLLHLVLATSNLINRFCFCLYNSTLPFSGHCSKVEGNKGRQEEEWRRGKERNPIEKEHSSHLQGGQYSNAES